MSVSARPAHMGAIFAPPLHTYAEGPTDPSKAKFPASYVVAVLGASRGIGAAIAIAYAKAGVCGFMLSARNETSLHGTAKAILSINSKAKVICQLSDLTKVEEVKELAEATNTAFGRLDVCVVAAGVAANTITDPKTGKKRWPVGVVEGMSEEFSRLLDTNVTGTYNAAKYMVPLLERTQDGPQTFIGISSAAAHQSASSYVPISYSLSKLAALRLVEQIHESHSSNGICAINVHPGGVAGTGLSNEMPEDFNAAILTEDVGLCGGVCVWLTKQKRDWLSGRYVSSTWDMDSLEGMKDRIVTEDLLKFRMQV